MLLAGSRSVRFRQSFALLLATFAVTLALFVPTTGCKRRGGGAAQANPATVSATANPRVRVVYVVPDGPPVDIFAADVKIVSNLAYKNDTGYQNALPGTFNVRATTAGNNTAVYGPAPVTLAAGRDYSVIVHGTVDGKNVGTLILTDERQPPAPAAPVARSSRRADAPL
jgi:hypothetical protein